MNSNLIFDVGLHKGEDSELYLKKGFAVVAVEANPALCEVTQERLRKYVDSGQLTIVNAAIVEKAGLVAFFVNEEHSVWGTTSKEWAARNESLGSSSTEIAVRGIEFGELLREYGVPYYLKIDIEGADLLCIESLENAVSKPKYVSIESNKTCWQALLHEFDLLKALGYSRFKVVDQSEVQFQQCPSPAREGLYVDHPFVSGSSGLFGEEAPGDWVSEQEALKIYRRIFRRYWLFGDDGIFRKLRLRLEKSSLLRRRARYMRVGWYDTHATLETSHAMVDVQDKDAQ